MADRLSNLRISAFTSIPKFDSPVDVVQHDATSMVATMYKQLDTVLTGIDPWDHAPNEDLFFLSDSNLN